MASLKHSIQLNDYTGSFLLFQKGRELAFKIFFNKSDVIFFQTLYRTYGKLKVTLAQEKSCCFKDLRANFEFSWSNEKQKDLNTD